MQVRAHDDGGLGESQDLRSSKRSGRSRALYSVVGGKTPESRLRVTGEGTGADPRL